MLLLLGDDELKIRAPHSISSTERLAFPEERRAMVQDLRLLARQLFGKKFHESTYKKEANSRYYN